MKFPVSIQDKKDFLHWFIQYQNIEAHDMNWFLNDLLDDERALFYVHFVQNIQYCPKGIIISTTNADQSSFTFFKGQVQTEDVYTAYHEIQLYRDESIFVQVDFPDKQNNKLYDTVLDDDISFFQMTKQMTENLLEYSLVEGKRNFLENEINEALDNMDYERFLHYSARLKEIT